MIMKQKKMSLRPQVGLLFIQLRKCNTLIVRPVKQQKLVSRRESGDKRHCSQCTTVRYQHLPTGILLLRLHKHTVRHLSTNNSKYKVLPITCWSNHGAHINEIIISTTVKFSSTRSSKACYYSSPVKTLTSSF